MKVLLIDVSINASLERTKRYIKSQNDADYYCIFDYEYRIYQSCEELLTELDVHRNDYFIHPCSLRDILTTIISKLRRMHKPIDVYLYSECIDDCSIYSTEESFSNYLYHIANNTQIKLYDFYLIDDNDSVYMEDCIHSYASSFIPNHNSSFIDRLIGKLCSLSLEYDYPDE